MIGRALRALGLRAGGRPPDLGVPTWWRVEIRVPTSDLLAIPRPGHALRSIQGLVGLDTAPPASGPEAALHFEVRATGRDVAERIIVRRAEGFGLTVLASRAGR